MFVVGITGGIGSGKSVVSERFEKLGITVVDADVASRVIVEPGQPALTQIEHHFGSGVIQHDGTLDRKALRELVFSDTRERKWLEALLHPLIGGYLKAELENANSSYAILVSPLLIEAGQALLADRILVVDVPEHVQIERVMARDDNTADQVAAIIDAQTTRNERISHADDVIMNDGTLSELDAAVQKLHLHYETLAKQHTLAENMKNG